MKTIILIILAVLQLGIPLAMIAKYEAVMKYGREYKFKCAPVDPVDRLRGRYVALRFEAEPASCEVYENRCRSIWVSIEKDENGFVKIKESSLVKPAQGDSIKMKIPPFGRPNFPFDKYFMNEALAPAAEEVYRKHTRLGDISGEKYLSDCYLVVKVWRGSATAVALMVGDKPIEELAREMKQR
jgi:uncharacterized membrane-anchored protein